MHYLRAIALRLSWFNGDLSRVDGANRRLRAGTKPYAMLVTLALLAAASHAPAATVNVIDAKPLDGELLSIQGDLLQVKSANGPPVTLRLPDVIDIAVNWRDRQHTVYATQPVTTAPAKALRLWRFEFTNDDTLTASINAWKDNALTLDLDQHSGGGHLHPRLERLRAFWCTSTAKVKKARENTFSADAQDVAFIEKDGEVKPVAGLAVGMDDEFLHFKFDGEERQVKLDRLVGVVLASHEPPATPDPRLYASFALINNATLSGRIVGFHDGAFRVIPVAGGDADALDLSLDDVLRIAVHNGRQVWLEDLHPSAVVQTPYLDRLMPYQVDQNLTGGPLLLSTGPVSKGIAVHSRCFLTYDIGGGYERFRAVVGFQQPEGKSGRVAIRVNGDGRTLWENPDLKGDDKPVPLDLPIAGVSQLVLQVDYGKGQDVGDRVIWGDARLLKPLATTQPAATEGK